MSSTSSITETVDRRFGVTRHRSASQLIFWALVGLAPAMLLVRAMGMVSQIAITSRFGAGPVMDAYFVASGLPILIAQFLISAIEASVIPVYARLRSQRSPEESSVAFSTIVNLFLLGTALLTLVLLIFRRQVIFFTAPALDPYRMRLAIQLAPIIFPVLFLMVIAGLLICVLNTEGEFGWPAYAGILVPIATALFVLVAGSRIGVGAIAIGTLAGVCLQLGVLVYRMRRARISYRPVMDWRRPEVGLVIVAAWPALLGATVNQASPLVDQIFASFLSAGSISALNYANKISGLPVGIVFVTVGRAVLPYLSRQAAARDMQSFKGTLRLYLWVVGLGTALLSLLMVVLAHPLVRILFQRGTFSPEDTDHTAITLVGFAVGLVPMGLGFLLARAFSALGKNHVLMYVTTFSVVANAGFDGVLARYWQSFGIALATSAVYCCNLVILLIVLRRAIGKLDLLTPPPELVQLTRNLVTREYYQTLAVWKREELPKFRLRERLRLPLAVIGVAAFALSIGAAVPYVDPQFALRVAMGLPLILLLLRYPYALLIAWILVGALVGSTLPVFNGNNFTTGLTIPTLLLLIAGLITGSVFHTLKRVPALTVLLLFVMWILTGIGSSPLATADFLKEWLLHLDYAAVAVLAVSLISSHWRLLCLVDAMLGIGAFVAIYGIVGYLTHGNGLFDSATGIFRILSVFSAAPALALFLSLVFPLAIYRAFVAHGLVRLLAFSILAVLLVAIGLTYSRGAILSVPLSIILIAFFLPSQRIRAGLLGGTVVLVGTVVILATVGNVPLLTRFFGQDVYSLNGRTYLWQALLRHFDLWQLHGNGLGAATAVLTRLNIGAGGVVGNGLLATAPSNLYIGTLFDTGIVGLGLLVVALAMLGVSLIVGVRRTTGERRLLFAISLLVLINMVIQSVEQDDLWSQGIALYFWIAVSLPFATCWYRSRPTADSVDILARHMPGSYAPSIPVEQPAHH